MVGVSLENSRASLSIHSTYLVHRAQKEKDTFKIRNTALQVEGFPGGPSTGTKIPN